MARLALALVSAVALAAPVSLGTDSSRMGARPVRSDHQDDRLEIPSSSYCSVWRSDRATPSMRWSRAGEHRNDRQ